MCIWINKRKVTKYILSVRRGINILFCNSLILICSLFDFQMSFSIPYYLFILLCSCPLKLLKLFEILFKLFLSFISREIVEIVIILASFTMRANFLMEICFLFNAYLSLQTQTFTFTFILYIDYNTPALLFFSGPIWTIQNFNYLLLFNNHYLHHLHVLVESCLTFITIYKF